MFRWICKQIDKWRTGNQLTQWGCGRWYVRYSDGNKSTTMLYSTACNYAEVFGGRVLHVTDIET